MVTGLTRLAVLANSYSAGAMREAREIEAAASAFRLEVVPLIIQRVQDISSVLTSVKDRADALYVCADPLVNTSRRSIVTFAIEERLPTIFGERENVEDGGLISYGPHVPDLYRRAAELVDKILRGTRPGDIPVEQPTRFELVINLKTAKTLGLNVPSSLLARADEVIE
jgi:putative ABC transport system substrate-binding protein